MNDWFKFNGIKCTEYGIHVSEHPPIAVPSERVSFTDVPGQSGSMTVVEGEQVYSDMTLTATCFISDTSRIAEIAAWLRGSGTVTFANRQGGYYYGRVINQIDFEKVLRGKPNHTFAVNFRVKPFFYSDTVSDISVTESGTSITNPGTVASAPLLKVTGTGEATLMIGQNSLLFSSFPAPIYVDCEAKIAYTGTGTASDPMLLATQYVTGEWMRIEPGANFVSFTSGITSVEITPRWRWL